MVKGNLNGFPCKIDLRIFNIFVQCVQAFKKPDARRAMNDGNFEGDQRGFTFRKIGDFAENFRRV